MDQYSVYRDIEARTRGEIYLGVVGPVRTGKSTFIKRFMELFVLPAMENEHMKNQTRDELPQSAAGKTIKMGLLPILMATLHYQFRKGKHYIFLI